MIVGYYRWLWKRIYWYDVESCTLVVCYGAKYSEITLLGDIDTSSDTGEGYRSWWSQVGEEILIPEYRCWSTIVTKYEIFAQRVLLIMHYRFRWVYVHSLEWFLFIFFYFSWRSSGESYCLLRIFLLKLSYGTLECSEFRFRVSWLVAVFAFSSGFVFALTASRCSLVILSHSPLGMVFLLSLCFLFCGSLLTSLANTVWRRLSATVPVVVFPCPSWYELALWKASTRFAGYVVTWCRRWCLNTL